jgi:hypothetical protein
VVGLGQASDAYAQRIMGNDVIIVLPHEFKHPSSTHCKENEVKKYVIEVVSNGTTSIPNFMKIRPAILELFNTFCCEEVLFGQVGFG